MRAWALVVIFALAGCGGVNPWQDYEQTDPVDATYARAVPGGRLVLVVQAVGDAPQVEAILQAAVDDAGGGKVALLGRDDGQVDHAVGPGGPFQDSSLRVKRYEAQLRAVGLDPQQPLDLRWTAEPSGQPQLLRVAGDAVAVTVRGQGEYALSVTDKAGVSCKGGDLIRSRAGRGFKQKPFELLAAGKPIAVEVLSDVVQVESPIAYYAVSGFGGDVRALVSKLAARQHHSASGVVSIDMLETTVWLRATAATGAAPAPAKEGQ